MSVPLQTVPAQTTRRGFGRRVCGIAAAVLVAVGLLVLVGWVLDLPVLKSVLPGYVPTKPNTAVGLGLVGVSLWLLRADPPRHLQRVVGVALAGVVVVLGGVTLGEYVTGLDLGIDQALFTDTSSIGNPHPGRPPLGAAVCLVLLGAALLRLDARGRRGGWVAQWLVLPAAAVALLAVVGYLLDAPSLVGIGPYADIALPTAVGLLVACLGTLAARPGRGVVAVVLDDRAAGPVARRLLPWAVGMPLLVGWLVTSAVDAGVVDSRLGVGMFVVITVAGFSAVILSLARPLSRLDADRQAAEDGLREMAAELSERVVELAGARTELQEVNGELSAQNVLLTRANDELQRFAYVASHDLQEPLRKIISFSRLLEEHASEVVDEDARMYLDRIVAASTRMQRLIDDLLMFSRAGRPAEVGPVDTGAALASALDTLAVRVEETQARVTLGSLPMVTANSTAIEQVFQNLVGNALKYRGDRAPRIHVDAAEQSGEWRFTVADNGIGIEQAYQKRIFQMFQRLHPRGQYEGTGIGLAVCQRIVESYDGCIGVESVAGEGSTFWFTLPLSDVTRPQEVGHDPELAHARQRR